MSVKINEILQEIVVHQKENNSLKAEIIALRTDNDMVSSECTQLVKVIYNLENANSELTVAISAHDATIQNQDANLALIKTDIESLSHANADLITDLTNKLSAKEEIESQSRALLSHNGAISA